METAAKLTIFYDGACPLCRREIDFYRRRRGASDLAWIDVSQVPEREVAPGLTKDQALARFHTRRADGTLISGGAAFAELWAALPAFSALGGVMKRPPLVWALNLAYPLFLKSRPRLQRLLAAKPSSGLPRWLEQDLRSDHAGETGAVAIYRGILAVSRDAEVRRFAEDHIETEREHLRLIETVFPREKGSIVLPIWRLAGFMTGALPALFGARPVFATVDAVETFVDHHYREQIERIGDTPELRDLKALLARCREDELRHRDEARELQDRAPGPLLRAWRWMVGSGSAAAVAVARRI